MICPDNTTHQVLPSIESRSPLPSLHIAARDFRARRPGSRYLLDSQGYRQELAARAIVYRRPNSAERDELNRILMEELVCGTFADTSIGYLQKIISAFNDESCDAVILGCTEIPLIKMTPIVHCRRSIPRARSRAALRRALAEIRAISA